VTESTPAEIVPINRARPPPSPTFTQQTMIFTFFFFRFQTRSIQATYRERGIPTIESRIIKQIKKHTIKSPDGYFVVVLGYNEQSTLGSVSIERVYQSIFFLGGLAGLTGTLPPFLA
jgi:hypothetical protein